MNKEIVHLRKRLSEFRKEGYDMLKERAFVIDKADFKKGKSIIEIGTGRGYMALTLARKGFDLMTIDSDRAAQSSARSILKYYHLENLVRFRIMDAEYLKFKDGAFDYVLAVNFMHHAENPLHCLQEMARVTRKKIVIVDVNKRGARILEKVHAREGHHHRRSKIGLSSMRNFFRRKNMRVKSYRSRCQTVIIAERRKP